LTFAYLTIVTGRWLFWARGIVIKVQRAKLEQAARGPLGAFLSSEAMRFFGTGFKGYSKPKQIAKTRKLPEER
jgi:hypothetical protein